MKKNPLLARPERAGYKRDYTWCAKCGAPKWVEWPEGIKRDENIGQVKICEPTCTCRVGWHSGEPNPVNASNDPPGWHSRKLVGIKDTQADIEAYYLEQLANAIGNGLEWYEKACIDCPSLKTNLSLSVLLKTTKAIRDRYVEQAEARKS